MKTNEILQFLEWLDEQELSSIRIAALLGDTFSLDHLLALTDIRPSKLLDLLDKMVKLDLISRKAHASKGTYFFCEKKLPEVVIQSIEKTEKRIYIAKIIEYLEKDLLNDDENPQILAKLFMSFKEDRGSFQYIKKAADLLVSIHKTDEALDLYKEIINSLLHKAKDPLETVLFIDSVISYAPIAIHVNPPEDILHILNEAVLLAHNLKNKRAMAMLELCLGSLYQKQGKHSKASAHYDKGWDLAQKIKDEELRKNASKLYALSLFWHGRIKDAIKIYEDTLGSVEEISSELRDLWAYLMLAYSYGISGRIGRGIGLVEAIRERAVSQGYEKTQAFCHGTIALILLEAQMFNEAETHIKKAEEIGEKIGSDWALYMAKPCKAYMEFKRGNWNDAKKLYESAFDLQKKLEVDIYTPWTFEIYLELQRKWKTIGGISFPSILKRGMNQPNLYINGAALRYHALSKGISKKNFEEVEQLLIKSHELLKEAGAEIELGRTQVELAKLYIEKKEEKKAKEFANLAYRTLSEIDSALFPSQLNFLIQEQSKEARKDHGISELESAIDLLPEFDRYLGKVVPILTDMFGAERAAILLMRAEDSLEDLHVEVTRNFSPEELELFNKKSIRSLISKTMKNIKPLIISDPKKNRILLQLSKENIHLRSLALIPLVLTNRAIGLIYMDNRLLKEIFSKQDLMLITAIATQLSLAFKTTMLSRQQEIFESSSREVDSHSRQIEEIAGAVPQIIGKSEDINDVLLNAKKVAETDATVLIYGETGVGKELIARAIHQLSNRDSKPFIVVNISALTENLITSELFGYEKGAFTGAVKTNPGRFEMANGGTIFLDEISEMSIDTQVKLLRVLQEGQFERVGSNRTIYSDFRLIVATNKNLGQKVASGDFRSDLFYRISSFPLRIPPLRERKEDIPPLALHFMAAYSEKNHKNFKRIPNYEMKRLLEYSWPGNIRELEHVIERAVILSEGEALSIPDFEPNYPAISEENESQPELLPLSEIERKHIIHVLNHTKWRVRGDQGAAKIIGLKPSTLEFRMKKLGIK